MRKYICNCTGKEKIGEYETCVFIPRYPDMEPTISCMEKEYLRANNWEGISIDSCLVDEIKELWSKGIRTTGCCCGHNQIAPYIGVVDEDIPKMKEMGYKVAPNPCRPRSEDSFYPKSLKFVYTGDKKLIKKHNHDHFWIADGVLFESYRTLRGLRYMSKIEVPGMPDMDECDEATITHIEKEYLN